MYNQLNCRLCFGISITKCGFCGQQRPKKKDLTEFEQIKLDAFIERINDLRSMYYRLIKYKNRTTGNEELDAEIRRVVGDWNFIIDRGGL